MIPPALSSLCYRSAALRTTATATRKFTRIMSTSMPFAVNAAFTVKEDRRDDFIRIISGDQKSSLADEPGCIRFVVGEDKDKKNTFYLHEEYVDEDAFKTHGEMPHFKPWDEFVKSDPWAEDGAIDPGFYFCTHEVGKKEPVRSGFALNAKLAIKADRRDEFLKLIKEDQEKTLSDERGSIQFVVGEDKDKENTFYLFEHYVNEEAYNEHNEMPHFKPIGDFMKSDPFAEGGEPVVGFYNVLVKETKKEEKDEEEPADKKQKTAEE